MRSLEESLLFSTLILGSVFSDYVVFYGDREILLLIKLIGSTRIRSIEWRYFQGPWMITNYPKSPHFYILYPFLYLCSGWRYKLQIW